MKSKSSAGAAMAVSTTENLRPLQSGIKVGDKTPWPKGVPFDREAIRYAKNMRGSDARVARLRANNQRVNQAKLALARQEDHSCRSSDPFEQARMFLGRLGIPVFSAAVYDDNFGPDTAKRLIAANDWIVGRDRLPTREAVIRRARAEGWSGAGR